MKHSARTTQLLERLGRLISNAYHSDGFKPVQWESLRFLSQANKFSRNPSALGEYLGVTKGSVSQTLSTLEQRGLIKKSTDKNDRRAVRLDLTKAGRALTKQDPLHEISESLKTLGENKCVELSEGLESLLRVQLDSRGRNPFGLCSECRFHQRMGHELRCGLLDLPLTESDASRICVEHENNSDLG